LCPSPLPQQPAGMPFRYFILLPCTLHRTTPPLRAQKFPRATSRSTCFSRASSAPNRFSRAFSFSSSFSRWPAPASTPRIPSVHAGSTRRNATLRTVWYSWSIELTHWDLWEGRDRNATVEVFCCVIGEWFRIPFAEGSTDPRHLLNVSDSQHGTTGSEIRGADSRPTRNRSVPLPVRFGPANIDQRRLPETI
jgi:hypothetical protein